MNKIKAKQTKLTVEAATKNGSRLAIYIYIYFYIMRKVSATGT